MPPGTTAPPRRTRRWRPSRSSRPSFTGRPNALRPTEPFCVGLPCLDVADTAGNGASFGSPGASRGESAFPQLRFVALVENGTHELFGARLGRYTVSETTYVRVGP